MSITKISHSSLEYTACVTQMAQYTVDIKTWSFDQDDATQETHTDKWLVFQCLAAKKVDPAEEVDRLNAGLKLGLTSVPACH